MSCGYGRGVGQMAKQSRTKIPKDVTRVRNAATGEYKMGEMTPQEINLAIAKLVYPKCEVITGYGVTGQTSADIVRASHGSYIGVPDYCNNWNDLMPLVIEHGVGLDYYCGSKEWSGFSVNNTPIMELNKSPQIALATCLLNELQEKEK